ncbi:MAG TPA: HAD hydrolase family protein [bacterium]|nr:HAD hydrolase family protein [bacterium]
MKILNQPLKEFKPSVIRQNIKAITFDLDGVIVPKGTLVKENADGTELSIKTKKLSPEMFAMIKELKKNVWLNFASGKALLYMQHMLEDILWDKVSLCAENGNFILINGTVKQLVSYKVSYFQKITNIRNEIEKLKINQVDAIHGFEPKHLIITVYTAKKVPAIEKIVKKHDKEGELYCLWTNEGYDIGHKNTSKVNALKFLAKELKIKPSQMITTGNNLNDKEMLTYGVGVSVDPKRVSGQYAIPPKKNILGGEVLASYLLQVFNKEI